MTHRPIPTPAPTTTAPSATPTATLPGAAATEVSETSDSFGQLTGVRVDQHPGYDRVVFEFADALPGYTVRFAKLPIVQDGSGEPVELPAADAAVEITFTPASGFDIDAGEATYKGPKRLTSESTVEITSVVSSGDFEAVLSWAVGLRHEVPFRVTTLENPARLVVDFQTS